jgi:hypothetical protein
MMSLRLANNLKRPLQIRLRVRHSQNPYPKLPKRLVPQPRTYQRQIVQILIPWRSLENEVLRILFYASEWDVSVLFRYFGLEVRDDQLQDVIRQGVKVWRGVGCGHFLELIREGSHLVPEDWLRVVVVAA